MNAGKMKMGFFILVALGFVAQTAPAQSVTEFPPDLPASFFGVPLDGGRVQAITVNPRNSSHIIVACQFGGLWKTEDNGEHWFHLNGLPTVMAVDVGYAPDGFTVIATLSRDNRVPNGGGIWVSRNGGILWTKTRNADPPSSPRIPERISAWGICYAPDDPNRVYVGTDYGLAVSDNNGDSWSHTMLETASPLSADKMQNAVFGVLALPGRKVIVLCRTGVWRYDQDNPTWRNIRAGDFSYESKNIDVSPLDSNKVFILQYYNSLVLYDVAAETWMPIAFPGGSSRWPFLRVSRSAGSSSAIDIWVGAGVVLLKLTCTNLATLGTVSASDWTVLGRGQGLHDDSGYLGLDASQRPVLYGSDGGLFKPTNEAATTWTRAATAGGGWNSYQITDLAGTNVGFTPESPGHTDLYFSTQDNALWASSDGGSTWPYSDCAEGFHMEVRKDAAADDQVTLAYGKVGCGPSGSMFSDAHLLNQRAIQDLDAMGGTLSHMGQVFFISPNNWVRYRVQPGSDPEIWISTNNGANWRRKATVALEVRGVFAVAGDSSHPTIYAPFKGTSLAADGGERIGLIRIDDALGASELSLGEDDLIYLPHGGSLGVRATEFDWQAVYGVDPGNPEFLIAPDIYNQQVQVSSTGGSSWAADMGLTSAVTNAGFFLLYDQNPYWMQVTHISFDPFNPNRILVGTRDAGVVVSADHGATWSTVGGSENMLYITGFFFKPDNTVIASTYGRGLWKIDFNLHLRPFPYKYMCLAPCILRDPRDWRHLPDPPDWADIEVVAFFGGRITGLALSGDKVQSITVSPGTAFARFVGQSGRSSELNIQSSEKAAGFGNLEGCLAALKNGEVIKGIALEKNKIMAILSGKEEWQREDLEGYEKMLVLEKLDKMQKMRMTGKPASAEKPSASGKPYVFVSTSLAMAGVPVLGPDGLIFVRTRGTSLDAKEPGQTTIFIDDRAVDREPKILETGQLLAEIKVPQDLSYGRHLVRVVRTTKAGQAVASGFFVKAAIDSFEK